MQNQVVLIVVIALVIAVGVAVWFYTQRRRTQNLRERFGPEYDRTVQQNADRGSAEEKLKERQERVEHLNIRALSAKEREQFAERWRSVQAQFVDDPAEATKEVDRLVREVMQTRGYPVGDFEQRAADISVDHPQVVEHYRAARKIALRNDEGQAETEELRQGLMHCRALFEELLETQEAR
jgi:cytoskeletal protein RodZ